MTIPPDAYDFVTVIRSISVPATECARIPKAFLEEERAVMGDWWFRQEYLCEFVDTEDSLFSRELVEAALSDEVEPLFPGWMM